MSEESQKPEEKKTRSAIKGEDLSPFKSGAQQGDPNAIDLMSMYIDEVSTEEQDEILKQVRNSSVMDDWVTSMANAFRLGLTEGEFIGRLKDTDMASSISIGDRVLKSRFSRLTSNGDQQPKGELARMMARNATGLGTYVTIDLPDSGITVSLRPCQRVDLANLRDRYLMNRYAVARGTGGMLNTLSMGATIQIFIDFVLDFVYFSSVGNSIDKLKKSISISDFDTMVSGLAEATWRTGYDARIPCTDRNCSHIEEGRIDFAQMRRYDWGMLTDSQLSFITGNPSQRRSDEDLAKYRSEFNFTEYESVAYAENEDFKSVLYFRTPTLHEYQKSVNNYYDALGRDMSRHLTEEAATKDRAAWMADRMAIDALMEFSPYFDRIEIIDKNSNQEPMVIRGDIELRNIFRDLVEDADIVKTITDGYRRYVSHTTTSIICLPRYDCPKCNKEQETHPRWDSAIPYNVYNVFFTMALLKLP